jgi:hypothetical protein
MMAVWRQNINPWAFYARSQNFEKFVLASSLPSVRMELLGRHRAEFHEIWYLRIFRKSVEQFQVSLKSDKTSWYFTWRPIYICDNISLGTLHEDQYTYVLISRSRFLRMKVVSDESCRENQITFFLCSIVFSENCAFYEIMWKHLV